MSGLKDLAAKYRALTARERASIGVLAAVLACFACAASIEWAGREARAALLARQSAGVEASMAQALEVEEYRLHLAHEMARAWRWSVLDDALAGESVRSEIESFSQAAGMIAPEIALVEAAPQAAGPIKTVSVTVEAAFDWASFLSFLQTLEESEKSYAISAVALTPSEEGPRVSVTIAAISLSEGAGDES